MSLPDLFRAVAAAFDGPEEIEAVAKEALLAANPPMRFTGDPTPLPESILAVMRAPDAHSVCDLIASEPLAWAPPRTSASAAYVAHSTFKAHVELIGPDGICPSDDVRLGLYGFQPGGDYGLRTHPAEEIFVMVAGEGEWKRGQDDYIPLRAGGRVFHPSMMPHATRSRDSAFMSLYVWRGDVSTDGYAYHGLSD